MPSGTTVVAAGSDFTGLDVVILIDQSGSMWGTRANDKWEHRIGQTKNIIYRLAEHVEGTSLVHRVAVVDFGDEASSAFPAPLSLRFDPKDPGKALREAKALVERYITAKNLQDTNTPDAMALGYKELAKITASERLDGRRRVMLLITDGRPDLPRKGIPLDELRNRIRNHANDLKSGEVKFWVVGLNDAANYWNEGDGKFWEEIAGAGHARLAETASTNISTLVQDIVNEWLEVSGTSVGKEYECPPYLRRIVFNLNFGLPRTTVSVLTPDGREIPLSSGGAASSPGTFARFVVDDPQPGTYKINQDPSRSYRNFVETLSPEIKRLSPAGATSVETEARIVLQALDSKGQPLEMLPAWPLNASFVITLPTGAAVELPATFKGDGKFEVRWKPPALGVYSVRPKGLVTLKNGSTFDVFGSNAHSYNEKLEVNDSRPYWLQMTAPDPDAGVRLMPMQDSTKIEFTLIDAKKEKVTNPESIVKEPATWLALELVDKSGVPLAAPVPLQPTAAGTFEANVPVSLNWKAGEGWWHSGKLGIRVNAQPDRLPAKNFLDSIALAEEAESKRVGDDPMTVGPLDVSYSRWFLGGLLLVVLLIGLGIIFFLMRGVLPGLLMWWIDSSRRRMVELKLYDGDLDPAGDNAQKYRAGRWNKFNYDRQVSVSVSGEDIVATTFRVKRVLSPEDVRAEVEYSWQNDPQKKRHRSIVTKGRAERLKGLSGGFLLRLDAKQ
ncbi:MAG: VWA domain-containing protein [Acidobacteria bacterium]|nr:VWA domain-containing protein [Acidobacteriota bacterium]